MADAPGGALPGDAPAQDAGGPGSAGSVDPERLLSVVARLRVERPVVHVINNPVTAGEVAAALAAAGARPVMAHHAPDAAEAAGAAGALVLNLGTPDPIRIRGMLAAARRARDRGRPVVLDPVGAGAGPFRTALACRVLRAAAPAVIRANAGEALALAGALAGAAGPAADAPPVRGVDAVAGDPSAAAPALARATGALAAVTGPVDAISDGRATWLLANGHPLLGRVPGTGCIASALVGACLAVEPADAWAAAAAALALLGVAAEVAADQARGPGTFRASLLDALDRLEADAFRRRVRLRPEAEPGPHHPRESEPQEGTDRQ